MDILTWKLLSVEDTHYCITAAAAQDLLTLRQALLRADSTTAHGTLLQVEAWQLDDDQTAIVVDLFAHLIIFATMREMSPEKVSTLVGVVHALHFASMSARHTRAGAYHLLRRLMIQHSVSQPPYSAAIFTLDDVHDVDNYLLETYFRHYKMYAYAFIPQEVATIQTHPIGSCHDTPPPSLPPLSLAVPLTVWKQSVEEAERAREEEELEDQETVSVAERAQMERTSGLNDALYASGVREQLEQIRQVVAQRSLARLDEIEQKLSAIEAKVTEDNPRNRPLSSQRSRPQSSARR